MFLIKKGRSVDAHYWTVTLPKNIRELSSLPLMLYQTHKNNHGRCYIKKAARKNFCNIHWKMRVLKSLLNKLAGQPAAFSKRDYSKHVFLWILRNFCFEEHLHTAASEVALISDLLDFLSVQSLSKPSWLINVIKIPAAFKPEF